MTYLLLSAALVGHAFLCVATVNRMQSTAAAVWMGKKVMLLGIVCIVGMPLVLVVWIWRDPRGALATGRWGVLPWPLQAYGVVCWIWAAATAARLLRRPFVHRPPAVLRWQRSRLIRLLRSRPNLQSEHDEHHFLVRIPGNESLSLDIVERALEIPRLEPGLESLSIIHLTDFHFTGRVSKAYFQEVIKRANQLDPDLIALTGDFVDKAKCIDWIPDTLGRLRAGHGVFFVLGNHDLRVDTKRLQRSLVESGLIDLGGRWMEIAVNECRLILAGNELPWKPPAADLRQAPGRASDGGGPLRIVLSHAPDQLDWARAHDVDLLLAGHLHGGQIRLPLIGPVFSPSRRGVRYASGVFYAAPTVMNVSRGVSGEIPLRLNCPPEMVHLTLHGKKEDL